MRQVVFPIAVRLARGERVALAPAVLASLYRDLRDIKAFLVAAGAAATIGNADMLSSLSLYSPVYILHLWIWERFPALRPGRESPVGDGEPMAARWHDLSRKLNPTLMREVLSSRDNFIWQLPYATSLKKYSGWVCSSNLTGNDQLRLLAHCLRPCELVGMDCIEQYLPHRVARQFGLDQDVPMDVCRANKNWVVAWQTYELEGKNVSLFIPQSEPGITVRYAQWWRQQLPPSDLHAWSPNIPVESKISKRKVKKTPAAMEAEAEKERRMKKARVSPNDKKRKLEELYDPKLSGWLAAGRSGISDAGSSCKRGSLAKYDMGSDEALLPNVGATNDDVVLLVPRMQTASAAVVVPKNDDVMNLAIGNGGNFIVDMPPEISNNELEGGATALRKEEKLNNPVDRSLDVTNKPEGYTAVMKLEKEAVEISVARSHDVTDRPGDGDTVVMKSEKEAVEISVARSLAITDRPEEGVTAVMESEKEPMETHNISEEHTTKVPQLEYEKSRGAAPIEEDPKENPTAEGKDLAEKDVDEATEVFKVKQAKGEGCDLLVENDGDNITDGKDRAEKDVDESTEVFKVKQANGAGCDLLVQNDGDNITDGKDLAEKDVDESTEVFNVKQAKGEGCDLLLENDGDNITDALGVEQEVEEQARALTEKGIFDHVEEIVEEITLVEHADGQSERPARIGIKDIPEEITQAHEEEPDNDMVKDLQNSTSGETPCSSATVHLKIGTMDKQCIQNVELNNQREPSSDADAMRVEGVYDHETMDMHEEVAVTQKHDHKIMGDDRVTEILEGSHVLDSGVKSDLITLEADQIYTAGGIQNQEISNFDKEMALKQDHTIIWEETMVSKVSHTLDSRLNVDLVTLEADETHAGGGINQEILGLDKEICLKQKQDHIIICENKETTEPHDIHMLDNRVKSNLVTLEVEETPASERNENQDILDFSKQGMNETQDLGTAIENNKKNMSEGEDIPVCSGYQIGTAIEDSKMNVSEDAGIPDCSERGINTIGMEINEVESTKRLQNQELLDNKEQPAMEERQHLGTTIETNKMNLPNADDVLVCGECQTNSTGTEVIEVKSTKGIENQELLDNKEDQVTEKRMECEIAYGSGVSLEEAYKLGDRVDTCAVAVSVSDPMQNKEACAIEEATEDKQHHEVEHVNEEVIFEDKQHHEVEHVNKEMFLEDKQHYEVEHVNEERILEDTIMINSGELKSDASNVEVDMVGSKEGTLNHTLSVEMEVAMQEKHDQEMANEDTNRDVADMNALECRVEPDGAVKVSHGTLTTQSVDIARSKISSENKEKVAPFEQHNITEVSGFESNQTTGMEPEGALPLEPENLVEVKQENLENEAERTVFRENDKASCKDQTISCIMNSPPNMDDQCEDDNGWAEESTKSSDKLASDSINTANPVKFGKSSNEEIKRAQNIRSMYLKDIKESLGRIRAEPNRVQTTNFGYPSRHAVQESHSACKEIKVPLRDGGRDFRRDRTLELVVTSPAEETSRWRQEQYALQILEDVQNARIAEKTKMEMEIRILKAQIASMERQVMNLDHFSESKPRSKRH